MDTGKIKAVIIFILALLVALYLGVSVATAQLTTVIWLSAGLLLITCIALGNRIWLLLPLGSALGLALPLPGQFSTEIIAQGLVVAFCTLLFLIRRLPTVWRFTELEFWCAVIIVTVLQAYFRNPVGLNIFGSDSIGARPYALLFASLATSFILSCLLVSPKDLQWWVRLTMIGSIANFGLGMIARFAPLGVSRYLAASFATDVNVTGNAQDLSLIGSETATRASFARNLSKNLALWITSKISPIWACFRPVFLILLIVAMGLGALSGFRSHLALIGLTLLVGIGYWNGIRGLIFSVILGGLGLLILTIINAAVPLPANVQRAFSFLPGDWGEQYVAQGENSTEWRVEMWKEALSTDRYIKNKWFGDGVGITREAFAQVKYLQAQREIRGYGIQGTSGFDSARESLMLMGDFHSGPVQTIKTTGYVGLFLMLIALTRVAMHAHRVIGRSRGTEWYSLTLFLCIPLVVTPFFWTFVFGQFYTGAVGVFMGTALIKLLRNNIPELGYGTAKLIA